VGRDHDHRGGRVRSDPGRGGSLDAHRALNESRARAACGPHNHAQRAPLRLNNTEERKWPRLTATLFRGVSPLRGVYRLLPSPPMRCRSQRAFWASDTPELWKFPWVNGAAMGTIRNGAWWRAWPGCRSRTKAKHVGKLLVAASKGKPLGTGLF